MNKMKIFLEKVNLNNGRFEATNIYDKLIRLFLSVFFNGLVILLIFNLFNKDYSWDIILHSTVFVVLVITSLIRSIFRLIPKKTKCVNIEFYDKNVIDYTEIVQLEVGCKKNFFEEILIKIISFVFGENFVYFALFIIFFPFDIAMIIQLVKYSSLFEGLLVFVFIIFIELVILRLGIRIPRALENNIDNFRFFIVLILLASACYIIWNYSNSNTNSLIMIVISLLYLIIIIVDLSYKAIKQCLDIHIINNLFIVIIICFVVFYLNMSLLNITLLIDSESQTHFICTNIANDISFFDMFYYTLINITSVGFGDIVPYSTYAKVFSMLTSLGGFVVFASLIGSAVSYKYISQS